MTEYIVSDTSYYQQFSKCEEIVRCRDCKHLDDSEYKRWDNSLAECYGEPPLFCDLLSFNEWRMDGDRRVVETTFAEVEPDGYCAWGEKKEKEVVEVWQPASEYDVTCYETGDCDEWA